MKYLYRREYAFELNQSHYKLKTCFVLRRLACLQVWASPCRNARLSKSLIGRNVSLNSYLQRYLTTLMSSETRLVISRMCAMELRTITKPSRRLWASTRPTRKTRDKASRTCTLKAWQHFGLQMMLTEGVSTGLWIYCMLWSGCTQFIWWTSFVSASSVLFYCLEVSYWETLSSDKTINMTSLRPLVYPP